MTPEPMKREAWQKAVRLGFDCSNWQPSAICRMLGRHGSVDMTKGVFCDENEWDVHVKCCGGLVGSVYVEALRREVVKAQPVREEPNWRPGDAAFWLDPELWARTPEIGGRPALCWMHLDAPVRGRQWFFDEGSGQVEYQAVWDDVYGVRR